MEADSFLASNMLDIGTSKRRICPYNLVGLNAFYRRTPRSQIKPRMIQSDVSSRPQAANGQSEHRKEQRERNSHRNPRGYEGSGIRKKQPRHGGPPHRNQE